MMKPKRVLFTLATQAAGNIAAAQTPAGAANLVLNGALAAAGVIPDLSLGYIIGVSSGGNIAARVFTVTGFDQNGNAQTEAITGVNANTVLGTKFWRRITSIAVDAACAAALTVETQNTTLSAVSPTYSVERGCPYTSVTADVSGTANFTLQKCSERPTAGETPNWRVLQAAGAVDVEAVQTGDIGAVRAQINSYTNGATLALVVAQAGAW